MNDDFKPMPIENRTARLTILIDPQKKALFERLCTGEDATTSQVVRRLIREYIERKLGRPWHPEDDTSETVSPTPGSTNARAR